VVDPEESVDDGAIVLVNPEAGYDEPAEKLNTSGTPT
jgi:hypothetical protein